MSLATKYRPTEFEDVCGQVSVMKILQRQLQLNEIKNCYLFCGPSGTGKTTLARIFANKINKGVGTPIEIDGASNNGVDNVRDIIKQAKERSLDSEYKIYIIDECHQITTAAWNAFLKCIEEPPKYTIFMFCTTEPNKIPNTILNRVMRFNLNRVPVDNIKHRLMYICNQEGFTNYEETCDYISKISFGGVRDAIATLEKASSYSTDLNIDKILSCLGTFSYDVFFDLTDAMLNGDEANAVKIINYCFNLGSDLKLFVSQFMDFTLELFKYSLFGDISLTKLPSTYKVDLDNIVNFSNPTDYFSKISYKLLELSVNLKNETNPLAVVTISILNMMRSC